MAWDPIGRASAECIRSGVAGGRGIFWIKERREKVCAMGLSWVVDSLLGWWKLDELMDGKGR